MARSLKDRFDQAVIHQQQGRADEAEQVYHQICAEDRSHFLARYNLGVLLYQRGQLAAAETCFSAAVALQPSLAEAALAHAKTLIDLRRVNEAVACYQRFLALKPDHANAWCDLGALLLNHGQLTEALASFDKTLAITPNHLFALYNRASALQALKRQAGALEAIDRLLLLKPDFVEAHYVRGNILRLLNRPAEALQSYDAALMLNSKFVGALNNRGAALLDLGRISEAVASFEQALILQPGNIEAQVNRGRALGKLGRLEEEMAAYNHALAQKPDSAEALVSRGHALLLARRNTEAVADLTRGLTLKPEFAQAAHALATAYLGLGRRQEALVYFEKALEISPTYIEAMNNRGLVLRMLNRNEEAAGVFLQLLKLKPDFPYAAGSLFASRLHCSDWTDYAATSVTLSESVMAGKPADNPFSFLAYAPDPAAQLACAKNYLTEKAAVDSPVWAPGPHENSKLRIAYVSADFHNHATSHLMAGLLEAHDRARFEINAVSLNADDGSPIASRVRKSFDNVINGSNLSDAAIVEKLRDMKTDIAVDLKGFTKDARPGIFIARAAPIQVNFLGYPGTFGHDCMDYIIADQHIIPPEHQPYFSEKVAYLPDCYQPNDRNRSISNKTPSRADVDLPEVGFVFCSFNGTYKITPDIFDVWMRLLKKIEGSVLWLFKSNISAERNLRREAAARGIAPERLIFATVTSSPEHLARQRLADLFLDTLPVCAHTTASDALWSGLPLVTCQGRSFVGRVAASVLYAAGLPELVTTTLHDYEALALQLATHPSALAAIKAKVMSQREVCALFDTDRYRLHIEAAYSIMWERYRSGKPRTTFVVPAIS